MPLPLFEFQEVGANFLASRNRAGLFDEMGVGKSAQGVRAADKINGKRGIVVCPAAVRDVWRGEFAKFGLMSRRIVKGITIHDFIAWRRGRFDVLVTSFEQLTKWAPQIDEMGEFFDFMIIDEGHYLKNDETARAKAILGDFTDPRIRGVAGVIKWAVFAWFLTGTPMANDPMDIYTFLRFVDCMPLKKGVFKRRYFTTFQKTFNERNSVRPDIAAELVMMIRNNSLRRTKAEIGIQLPPIFLRGVTLDGDQTAILELLGQYPGLSSAIVSAVRQGGLSFLDAQHVATLRRLVGEAKAIPYAALLFEELSNSADKYVVMGIHRKALASVQEYLAKRGVFSVMVNGDTPEKQRAANVLAFQEDPKVRVFLGNIKSAGTGLTLTAACNIDMLESDWTPAGNAQAIMRVHRVGQVRNVIARFITLAGSIDEAVNAIVAEKTAAIASIEGSPMNSHPPLEPALEVA